MVKRVNRKQIDAALGQLEQIDPDVANSLRAFSDYRALIKEDPLDMRDTLLAYEEQIKDLGRNVHELAMTFEQMGKR